MRVPERRACLCLHSSALQCSPHCTLDLVSQCLFLEMTLDKMFLYLFMGCSWVHTLQLVPFLKPLGSTEAWSLASGKVRTSEESWEAVGEVFLNPSFGFLVLGWQLSFLSLFVPIVQDLVADGRDVLTSTPKPRVSFRGTHGK